MFFLHKLDELLSPELLSIIRGSFGLDGWLQIADVVIFWMLMDEVFGKSETILHIQVVRVVQLFSFFDILRDNLIVVVKIGAGSRQELFPTGGRTSNVDVDGRTLVCCLTKEMAGGSFTNLERIIAEFFVQGERKQLTRTLEEDTGIFVNIVKL